MRILAIGDIHGCFRALSALVEFVPFRPDDRLITLGDYVDRGPNSAAVLDWLVASAARGNLVALRGNHEVMMLDARHDAETFEMWFQFGGDATLASYASEDAWGDFSDVPASHWAFLERETRGWYETEGHFFVHANVDPDVPLAEQPEDILFWEPLGNPRPHCSGKVMVCGHTSQRSGLPRNLGHAVCIDTWVYGAGWLTCLDVGTGEYWQANQRGETRRGTLDAL